MRCVVCGIKGGQPELGRPGTIEVTAGLVTLYDTALCVGCVRLASRLFARAAWSEAAPAAQVEAVAEDERKPGA